MIINSFPTTLVNGTAEDATQVMSLLAWVQSQTNGNACPATSTSAILKGNGTGGTTPASSVTDYVPPTTAQNNALCWLGTDAGAVNVLAFTLSTAVPSYVAGQSLEGIIGTTNTGAATINISAVGAIALRKRTSGGLVALSAGDLIIGNICQFMYDGTYFQVLNFNIKSDSTPLLSNSADPTKLVTMSLAGLTTGTTRTITLPDKSGIMAMLSDIILSTPQITTTVAANNLTVALAAGFSCSFRSTTLSDGTSTVLASGTISLVVPSGATLGAPTAITSASATMAASTTLTLNAAPSNPVQVGAIIFQAGARIGKVASLGTYVGGVGTGTVILDASATFTTVAIVIINPARLLLLAINNAGTIELAVSNQSGNLSLDETRLISTTAIGAGSTSATVIYSTTGRTNVAYKVIGFVDIAQATVGTYALVPELTFGAITTTLAAMWAIGNGQTWANLVATERVSSLNYVNITGRPITWILVQAVSQNAYPVVNGLTIGAGVASIASQRTPITIIVPAGAVYSYPDSPYTWDELR